MQHKSVVINHFFIDSKTLLKGLDDTEEISAVGSAVVLKNFIRLKGSELFHAIPELVQDSLAVKATKIWFGLIEFLHIFPSLNPISDSLIILLTHCEHFAIIRRQSLIARRRVLKLVCWKHWSLWPNTIRNWFALKCLLLIFHSKGNLLQFAEEFSNLKKMRRKFWIQFNQIILLAVTSLNFGVVFRRMLNYRASSSITFWVRNWVFKNKYWLSLSVVLKNFYLKKHTRRYFEFIVLVRSVCWESWSKQSKRCDSSTIRYILCT